MAHPKTLASLKRQMPSRLAAVDQVCGEIREFLRQHGLGTLSFNVELVARECLNNAILHGNHSDERKQAEVNLTLGRKWIRLQVADEGAGFNWRRLKRQGMPEDDATHGRGLPISQLYSGRVKFNRRGNQIAVWFLRNQDDEGSL